jgi:choline transport protein
MTEEMKNASKEAPKAIIMSVYLGAVTGFIFLVSAFFCIGDLEATADTSTGVPLIEIFYNSTGSVAGANVLASLITVIVLVCANSLMAEGSRALYAFARDRGLPFSSVFSKVDAKKQVPIYAILLAATVQMALNAIYFGSVTGFFTVISIATEGFYLSYAMPLFVRILARFTGHAKVLPGPYTLGKWGIWLNVVGLVFLTFAAITFNFPSVAPVTSENMNYCSAAIGVIALVSLVTWVVDGRKNFRGPQIDVLNATEAEKEGVGLGVKRRQEHEKSLGGSESGRTSGSGEIVPVDEKRV